MIILIILSFQILKAQTILYNQNFGSGTTFPAGWTASGTQSTNLTVNTSSSSSGYTLPTGTNASGNSNVTDGYPNSTIGTSILTVAGVISTSGQSGIKVTYGARKTNAYTGSIAFEWSPDGTTWNTITYTDVTNNASWKVVNGGAAITLPAGADNQANLRFRWTFVRTNTSGNYRIDDFIVYTGSLATPTFTELVTPKYIGSQRGAGTNNAHTTIAVCFQMDNLTANTIYNFRCSFCLATDAAAATPGAGNIWSTTTSAFVAASTNSFTITTNSVGSTLPCWIYLEPTGNARFATTVTNLVVRIMYSTGAFTAATPYNQTSVITPIDVSSTAASAGTTDDGAFLKLTGVSGFSGKYALVFSNTAGTGNPLFSYQFRTTTPTQATQAELPTSINDIYRQAGTSAIGDAPQVIPIGANNLSGVQRIEIRNSDNSIFAYFTKSTGIWDDNTTTQNTTTIARTAVQTISLLKGVYDDVGLYGDLTEAGNMTVTGTLDIVGTTGLSIATNTLTLNGTITNSSLLAGNSTSNLTISGSSTSTVGTLNFSTGNQTLNSFVINRNANPAATMGNNLTVNALTLTNGYLTVGSSQTLTIANTGTITSSSGDLSAGNLAGTVSFAGSGTVSATGALNFYDVILASGGANQGVNFGSTGTPTINNSLTINSSQYVTSYGPYYGTSSTLIYNTGGVFGAGTEWYANATSGRGIPQNVQIGTASVTGSGLSFTTSNAYRQCLGNFTIGATSGSGYSFSLSTVSGGDLYLGGNWIRNTTGTFTPNITAVFFNGNSTQTITVAGGGTETFKYFGVNKSANNVQLTSSPATNVIVNGSTGDVLQLLGSAGGIDLNGRTFTLNAGGGNILTNTAAHTITGSAGSIFSFNYDGVKTVTVTSGGTLLFDNNVLVKITAASTTAGVDFGSFLTTINGTLQMNGGSYVLNNAPTYGTGSLLQYNSGGVYNRTVEWGTTTGPGYPYNVQVSTSGTTLVPGGSSNTAIVLNTAGNVTIDAGCALYMDYGATDMTVPLTVGADLIINGNLSESDISGGDVIVKGNWYNNTGAVFSPKTRAVYFSGSVAQTIGGTQSTTFDYLINSNTTADVSMLQNVTVNQKITLQTNSVLAINGKTVTLNATVDNTVGNAGTFRGSTSSNMFIGGSGSLFGTLLFTPTAQILDSLTMNRTGVTGTAALLGANNDLVTTNLVLNNGILTSGNNLLTVTNVLGSARAATVAFTNDRDTTDLKQSFVALCDGSNNPVTDTTGAKGFKIKSVGTTEKIIPIGYSYNTAPNRISLKDQSSPGDDYTITLFKGDILGTPKPRVNRIWHIKKATSASTNISMKLYFFKRTALYGSATNDELEDGFIWSDARLLHRVYANTIPNGGFTNTSGGVGGAADVIDFTPRTSYTEIYAAYTWGISPDNTYPSPPADGIRDFSGISYFSVANVYNFILPVTIVNLKAYQQGSAIKIDWTALTENNVARYEVQRAANTLDFTAIGTQDASPAYAPEKNYSFTDLLPMNGNNYYRISAIDKDGKVIVSNIVMVTVGKGKEGISIYPNPVKARAATIQFTNTQQGKYNVVVYSASGTKLLQKTVEHLGGSAAYQFILPQDFASGMYHVMIMGETIKVQKNLLVE